MSGVGRLAQRLWNLLLVTATPLPDKVTLKQSSSEFCSNFVALMIDIARSRRLS